MANQREHILGLTLGELTERVVGMGLAKFRAKQVFEWVFQKRAVSFEEMTNLSKADRVLLGERFEVFTSQVVRSLMSADGTRKVLLEWPDGGVTECVMIPADEDQGEAPSRSVASRRTACLSTQVGCAVGCKFCASGMGGLKRNLTVGEVVEEALRLTHLLPREVGGHRLTHVVFMGMG